MEQSGIDPAVVDWLEAHANNPVVKRAWLLANGLGTLQDKRDHIQDLKAQILGIAIPLPYDKGQARLVRDTER
jgi:hypothetical protein